MPDAAPRPCLHFGCGRLAEHAGRCREHAVKRSRAADASRRKVAGPRKYDLRAWRDDVRPAQLRREPLCRACRAKGWLVEAFEVDHIDGDNTNDAQANLQSLCKPCHSRKTVRDDGGLRGKPG